MQYAEIRIFPEQSKQVDSGPIRFGGDWPGVFMRGDHALAMAEQLRAALRGDNLGLAHVAEIAKELEACRWPSYPVEGRRTIVQSVK